MAGTESPWADGISVDFRCDDQSILRTERSVRFYRWRIDNGEWTERNTADGHSLVEANLEALEACPGATAIAIEEPIPGRDLFLLPEPG